VGADMLSSEEFGSSENLDVFLKEGAGGPFHLVGDYLWQNHRMPYTQAGEWGYLRVLPVGDRRILPLNSGEAGGRTADVQPENAPEKLSGVEEKAPGPVSMLEKTK
jgi:hypothetical protein